MQVEGYYLKYYYGFTGNNLKLIDMAFTVNMSHVILIVNYYAVKSDYVYTQVHFTINRLAT